MTDLEVRRIPFDFSDDVPFAWQPENAEFSILTNAISFVIIGFEKYIVSAIRDAMKRIDDPRVAAEADAFLRQEAQHSRAHRLHVKALAREHPGLQDTLDQIVERFDRLYDDKSLDFHLAYIAGIEATFTPTFKMMLDHHDELFQPGDDRVASLFLWHFVEEIEHRSSALIIYDHCVSNRWSRVAHMPTIVPHIAGAMRLACDGFNEHVPPGDRLTDARNVTGLRSFRRRLGSHFPAVRRGMDLSSPPALIKVPADEQKVAYRHILGSQTPNHDPEHQPLPAFAAEWFARYEHHDDVSHWYSSQPIS